MCFVLKLISAGSAVASDLRRRGGVCSGGCKSAVCDEVMCREGSKSEVQGAPSQPRRNLISNKIPRVVGGAGAACCRDTAGCALVVTGLLRLARTMGCKVLRRKEKLQRARAFGAIYMAPHEALRPLDHEAQAPAFIAGAAGCALVIVAALRTAEEQFTELFHIYYQPLLVLLAMLWMWGANVRFFEARRVRYGVCFSPHDQAFLLTGRQIHQAKPPFALIICPIMHSASHTVASLRQSAETSQRTDYPVITISVMVLTPANCRRRRC